MPSGFRWWIVAILFLSTVINYIDRQTLSVLAPLLKVEHKWNNEQFGVIIIAFRIAYTIGQAVSGRFIDRLGTRQGLTVSVAWYSFVAMATTLATGLRSFCVFRFLLGIGESANWPGATKAVSEWFPRKERALAVAIFDSGSSIGAAVAPVLVLAIYHYLGGWRPAFLLTGTLGFLWLIVRRRYYYSPEHNPWVRQQEKEMILRDRETPAFPLTQAAKPSWIDLLRYRQTWGAVAARGLTDPVWFFITDWFAIYLTSRGFRLEQSLLAFWIPFLCADLGNYAGGAASSWLVHRNWPVGRARKAIVIPGGLGVLFLIPAAYSSSLGAISLFFGLATFSYAAFSTIANTLPADLFDTGCVASVSGITGAAAGLGTIVSTYAVGYFADRQGFQPVVAAASAVPVVAMALVLLLVRNTRESGKGTILHV